MEILHTDKAPAAIGPYSQAIETGGLIFASGQLGLIPDTGALAHSMAAQTVQALENVISVLKAAGLTLNHVVKTTCYLRRAWRISPCSTKFTHSIFKDHKPAHSLLCRGAASQGRLGGN